MNIWTLAILTGISFQILLETWAEVLNFRHTGREIPAPFRGVYDPARYGAAKAYLHAKTRLGWTVRGLGVAALLLFWFGAGFDHLDMALRKPQLGPVSCGLLYVGALLLALSIGALPFDLYRTFGIEARFGFNRTDLRTFFTDRLKSAFLLVILGGPLLAGVLYFFEYFGVRAWLWAWVAAGCFTLCVQFVAPVWLLPLFNRFAPLESGPLRSAILEYAKRIGFALNNIVVMDGSRRSSKSNAFFTGLGKNRRIVLFDTLITRHGVSELVAVLAHEMGHYRMRHVAVRMVTGIVHTGVLLFLLGIVISDSRLFEAFYMTHESTYAGLVFFSILFGPVNFFAGIAIHWISRRQEYAADRFAARTTGDSRSLIGALKRLSVDNLSHLEPHEFYVALNYSHPPVLSRIQALERMGTSELEQAGRV